MNVETLDKAELLMLLSILEGELEAQDVVIHTLRVRHSHQRTENNERFFPKVMPLLWSYGSDCV